MEDPALSPSADDSDPIPQIQSNVEGDGNQVIDQVTGSNVIGNITCNVIIPTINNYYYREELQIPINNGAESTEADQLPCPYRGLFHFGPGDAEYFFGREGFVEELVRATQSRNFIPLLGASGNGKSSVVLAGLVPKLQQVGHWQFTHFRPGADPFYALAEALVPLYMSEIDSTDKITQAGKLAESLKNGTPLSRIFSSIQRKTPDDRVLLIADQFEELYTLCTDETIRRNFLDKLIASIAAPADRLHFAPVLVLTMRADFLGDALSYRPFADILQNADLKLGPMNRAELTEAVKKPAQKLGVTFEARLVERILSDVEKEPGTLPLLEFALTKLWQGRSGKQLTHAAYEEIGEVKGALAKHANQEFAKLTEADQERVRRIFIQLVRPGEGMEDTRRIALKTELGDESWLLVKKLADARLVVTTRNAGGQETVEVVHEALIRNWKELQGWMEIDRVFRAWQERLRGAMRQWQETKQDKESLLRGAALAEAEEHWQKRSEELASEESKYIKQSRQERKRIEQDTRLSKIKEMSSYCILGSLVTLCFFLIKDIDIEYIMAKEIARMQNRHVFFVTKPGFSGDKRNDYYYDLLRLALENGYTNNGNRAEIIEKIEIRTRTIDSNQGRKTDSLNASEKAINKQKIDVDWMMPTIDRNALANRIDFPLTLGLLSHRLCFVKGKNTIINDTSKNKEEKEKEKEIIKNTKITQVKFWPDVYFLERKKEIRTNLEQTENYEESVKQLLDGTVNCFLRGLNEIHIEQEQLKEKKNKDFPEGRDLLIEDKFFFQYYSPENFYVAQKDETLAGIIKEGLDKSLKNGELLCVYKRHYGDSIEKAKLDESQKISIDADDLKSKERPELYLDFTKKYKDVFKDIEEYIEKEKNKDIEKEKNIDQSECTSLHKRLRDQNKKLRF
jgi:hypothetical protein